MFVLINAVIYISGCIDWINMDRSIGKVPQLMQETVSYFLRYFMSLFD